MKHTSFIGLGLLLAILLTGCYHRTDAPRGSFAKGADISWLSEMERDGVVFRDESLELRDCIALLREEGMNAVRLRVWVNHPTGWSNKADMLSLARRAAKQGQRIMIDFHYSDFFADPHSQTTPAAWKDYTYEQLCEAVREHTLDVFYALKEEGIKPEWVQIGNETPNGMLWPVGELKGERTKEEQWEQYVGLTNAGYKAAKEAFPDVNVIVHIDNAYEYRDWFWQALLAHGGRFDMIGLSHYPMMREWSGLDWQEMNERAEENVRRLINTFHKPVMICEVGILSPADRELYTQAEDLSQEVMNDFVQRMVAIDSCKGIFYWEPEVYGGWRPREYIPLGWGSYNMGAFTPDGCPAPALRTLLR